MTSLSVTAALERLAPPQQFVDDWADVLGRVEAPAPEPAARDRRRTGRTRRLLVAAALVATVVVLAATAVAAVNDWSVNDWWLLGSAPAPVTTPVVVKSGTWDGKGWELVAYRSASDGICVSMIPVGADKSNGVGAAMSCGGFDSATPSGSSEKPNGITFLSGSSPQLPTYIVGPVVNTADEVVISFANGDVLRTPAFDAPESLGDLRFYAARVPGSVDRPRIGRAATSLQKLVGLTEDGQVVACLKPGAASPQC